MPKIRRPEGPAPLRPRSGFGQPGERGWAIHDPNRGFRKSLGVASDNGVTTTRLRRGCADSVLEIGPAKSQGSSQNLFVNGCYREGPQDSVGRTPSESGALGAGDQGVDGRYSVGRNVAPTFPPLHSCPHARRTGCFGSIQDHVEHDVQVEQ
jgi:hypothetical protein